MDHCVPADVARMLGTIGHDAWTAYDAGLETASDREILAYANEKQATIVTTNKDFVPLARRLMFARVVYLKVKEQFALDAMRRAVDWLAERDLPDGMVLRVPRHAEVRVMSPLPWSGGSPEV